jgi:predicted hydrolase (HD superfamily)
MNRSEALNFLEQKVKNQNIIKHMLATEALMGDVYEFLKDRGDSDLGEKEDWAMAGLLHDGDYSDDVPEEKQGLEVSKWLEEAGISVPQLVAQAMAAHNVKTGVKPQSKMDWTIFCGDSLTGLVVACALVQPDKKLASVKLESVLKKFKDKSFAGGTRREDIALCEKELNIPLKEFIEISLKAMQKISDSLGL